MLHDIVSLGDKIDIKQLDHLGKPIKSAKVYTSMLLDYTDEDMISVAMPTSGGRIFVLENGENYSLCFYTNKGLYQCSCQMVKTYKENNTIVAAVRLTTDLEKFQRRQYYRLECVHEIEYRVITQEETLLETQLSQNRFTKAEDKADVRRRLSQLGNNWKKGSISNLSGGGLKFNSDEMFRIGDRICIKLDFIISNELKKMVLSADIIASDKLMNLTGKYEHRAQFSDIGKMDREDLIKYIFEQDRRRRKNI